MRANDGIEKRRLEHVEALLHEALSLSPPERGSFLDTTCAHDRELRREVESLLAHSDEAESLFDSARLGWSSVPSPHDSFDFAAEVDAVIGPYRLVERIGIGGMGDVYRALRVDEEFDQTVAVKLIRQGLDTEDILARFRRERQVLASLNHPNIARLLDGGTTADGRPYLVMEYVDGRRIDAYCDAQRLTLRSRVELFRVVCEAVQFAHRNLVVHRDLKPANILVECRAGAGETVKLLDFGIAKVLAGDGDEAQVERTLESGRRLTLAYASPEQVRGEAVTTAADVYSLGAVLYRLLTGHSPHETETSSPQDLERMICEEPPRRPAAALIAGRKGEEETLDPEVVASQRSSDIRRLQRELCGDLETILLTALQKDPARRYATVKAFSDDLRQFLAGAPIAARPDSLGYRLKKFVGRNRVGVAAGITVALALITATIISSLLFLQARSDRSLAQRQTRTALTINSYLTDLLTTVEPEVARGRDVSVFREALDRTAERVLTELADAPEVASILHHTIGEAYYSIGQYEQAVFHLEHAVASRKANDLPREDRVKSLLSLGLCLVEMNRFEEGEQAYAEALELSEGRGIQSQKMQGLILARLGHLEGDRGNYDAAETHLRSGLELLRASKAEPSRLSFGLEKLGHILVNRRRTKEAFPLLQEAKELLLAEYGELHPRIATIETELGWCERRSGNVERALHHYEAALEIRRTIFEPDHYHVANSRTGLASVLADLGRFEEAEQHYLSGLEVLIASFGRMHTETGTAYNNLGGLYRKMGRPEAALDALHESAEIYVAVRGADDYWVSFPLANAALCLLALDRHAEALSAAEECLAIRRAQVGEDSTEVQSLRSVRGAALTGLGRFDEAEAELLGSYESMAPELPPDSVLMQRAVQFLVELQEAWDRPGDAAAWRELLTGSAASGQ